MLRAIYPLKKQPVNTSIALFCFLSDISNRIVFNGFIALRPLRISPETNS